MSNKKSNKIIKHLTCFSAHETLNIDCQKKSCRCWFDNPDSHNCVVLCTKKKGPHKQEDIGKYFGLTRMRVCQIEKSIMKKIEDEAENSEIIKSLKS